MRKHYLQKVFEPESVAVVGASEREMSVGGQLLRNLVEGKFSGDIYPVNPKHKSLMGLETFASIKDIDRTIDLVVITVPAVSIPAVIQQCGEHGVGAVVVISAGFGEAGDKGRTLQAEIIDIARTYNVPLIGPNCLGVVRPRVGLNASFARSSVKNGQVALVAQSGAFCTALLDWGDSKGFGFSAVASLGATADVGFGEVLDYLAVDPQTRSILLYIEGISDARSFICGLRVAARLKPVIVVKSGRSESGTRAAVSHTGALVGGDEVFDAAIGRAGAVRVTTVNQLFAAAQTLASGTRVLGSRLAILTNGGGPGVMAADRAADLKVPLATLTDDSIARLNDALPAHWSHSDPVDILGDADAERYRAATEIVLHDSDVDGLLVLLTPQAMTNPTACARAVIDATSGAHKPVLACWLGERLVDEGRQLFAEAGIPHFASPEGGVDAFGYLAAYHRNQDALLQAPPPLSRVEKPDVEGVHLIIEHAMGERRDTLSTTEAKAVLRAFRIPISQSINTTSAADALVAAESLGLPVAMKINSPDIPHKTDVGGVRLNVSEPHAVRRAYREMTGAVKSRFPEARLDGISVEPMQDRPHAREVMVGIARDPIFGPVISFGIGGTAVDIYQDSQIALPPLNEYLCRDLISRSKAARILGQFRNLPEVDVAALVDVLMRVSEMACELPELQELDINPLLVDENGVTAVDARIIVAPPQTTTAHYGHMAIHPYPPELETTWHLDDGTDILVRPIRPEDAIIEKSFVENLSVESRYFRFMSPVHEMSRQMLARFTQIDYDREMALVAVIGEGSETARIIGVARYISNPDGQSCEFALTVADDWQKKGIGRQLMQRLMTFARDRGLEIMEGDVLSRNHKMLRLCQKLGFRKVHDADSPDVTVVRRHL
jgi:acetyltransferase